MPPKFTVRSRAVDGEATGLLIVPLSSDARPSGAAEEADRSVGEAIARSVDGRAFRGGRDETLHLTTGRDGTQRVLLVGMGKGTDRASALRRAAAVAARAARRMNQSAVTFAAGELSATEVEAIVVGASMGAWEYTELKSPPPEDERKAPLETVAIATVTKGASDAVERGLALAHGYDLARRLAMMPGNLCTPDLLAETARDIAARHKMTVSVLGRAEMEREGMGSFLSVAQGTPQDPKLIVLEYSGGRKGDKPVALVGKGLCFDSGGISIKPAQGMEYMKFDMCGAAGVLGAMEAIARMELPLNVIGLIGATTNMPSGVAVKPGDVVKSHLGKSIEIINTDAEGRLVLADVLSYARKWEPVCIIDAATLTGACVIALGHTATGVFGPDEALVTEVLAAGKRAGEPGWPLPVWDDFKELIKSDVADMKNSGGRPAGSISAAMFLKEFTEGMSWVHLDIAGTAYSENDLVTMPKGPTGVPVGLFVEFVRARAR